MPKGALWKYSCWSWRNSWIIRVLRYSLSHNGVQLWGENINTLVWHFKVTQENNWCLIWKKTKISAIIWMVLLIKNGMQIFSYISSMIYQRPFSQQWRAIQQGIKGLLEQSKFTLPNICWFCNYYFPRKLHWSLLGWWLCNPFKHKLYLTCLHSVFTAQPIWFLSYILISFVTVSILDQIMTLVLLLAVFSNIRILQNCL